MPRLSDLIRATTWAELEAQLLGLYPKETENLDGHRNAFREMTDIEPSPHEQWIVIEPREDRDDDGEPCVWHDVSCTDLQIEEHRGSESRYALDGCPWPQCLGMRIKEETRKRYSDLEIVAHCLWELTFYGYDAKIIQAFSDELDKIDDPDRPREPGIPLSEMLRNLGLDGDSEE